MDNKTALPALVFIAVLFTTAGVQAMRNAAPVNTAPPAISGTAKVGQTLTASDYTVTLRATDKSWLTSLPARRTFTHG